MTTRDPRSRDPHRPSAAAREPTQSLSIPADEVDFGEPEPSHPSLALGTHDAAARDEKTKVESPMARSKPPDPAPRPPPVPRNPDDPQHRIGTVLGTYRMHELLGKGGMGYVFRAEHVKLGREVALKLLRSDYSRRRDAVARFFQEARTVNRVRHRNIVDVTDFVELDDGTTFIIMEFLRGQSLGKWARTGIDLPRALAVLVQICDGLGAAHDVGVIHRDLKPDNVIVVPTSDGAELVKLLDFGVAKLLNRDDEDVGFQTAAGSVIGTPAYMSPEQAGGMQVDHRSDIYSLGAIMYELFCGQPMFKGRSFGEYVRKHLTEQPVPPRATPGGAQIDPRLEAVILRSLDKEPSNRFGTIQELRENLLGLLGGMETHPPGYVTMGSSAPRPAQMLPAVHLPLQPPVSHVPTPPVGSASQIHPSQLPLHYSTWGQPQILQTSQVVPPQTVIVQATPWWVWFVGGAIAVAIGVGAAVWYAGRGDPKPVGAQAAPQQGVQSQPLDVTPPPPGAQLVEVRFDSLPSGGVYADGQSAELCRTPCTYNIDLRDGGPVEKRTFVVRSEGYKDAAIVVDVQGKQREFRVTLERTESVAAEPAAEPERPVKGSKKKGKGKKVVEETKPQPPEPPKPEPPKVEKVEKPADPPKQDTDLADPTDGKKKPKKPGVIDPAETVDPFHPKK